MLNVWHDTALMQTVSRITTRVALVLLIIASIVWVLKRPYFAINHFSFVGDVKQLNEESLRKVLTAHLSDSLAGGFFSMELNEVQASLSGLTWIKSTSIRRVWPHELEVEIEAYQPIASWGERYLSPEGQLFESQFSDDIRQKMLVAVGPDAASQLVAQKIPLLQEWFRPTGWKLKKVDLSARYSWRVSFDNGIEVELGRADTPTALEERALRLVRSMQFVQDNLGNSGGYIDLRYPNGFAMRTSKLHRITEEQDTVKTGE